MYFYRCFFALFVFNSLLVLAQQSCYWPDGSSIAPGQGPYVNCHSSQDSVCCFEGEVCLSNGLCYGSKQDLMYRGACTVKDWSNTTACPPQWCSDGEDLFDGPVWVHPNHGPHVPYERVPGTVEWWCGNDSVTKPCETGIDASFVSPTTGTILGIPPLTPSPSGATRITSDLATTTFSAAPISIVTTSLTSSTSTRVPDNVVIAAPTSKIKTPPASSTSSTDAPVPTPPQEPSTNLPIAIGVGIGVPLGIATIGLLVFLFWKEAARQRRNKPQIQSQKPGLQSWDQPAVPVSERPWTELPDDPRPGELGGNTRAELPNI